MLPVVIGTYILAWGIPTVIGIPFLYSEMVGDPPGTYEVITHFFWDWIVHPLATLFIGVIAAETSIKTAVFIAPSRQAKTGQVISVIVLLLAVGNTVLALISAANRPMSDTAHAVLYNVSLGGCAVYFVVSPQALNTMRGLT